MCRNLVAAAALVAFAFATVVASAAAEWGLKVGSLDLKSAGPLAFGPDGILLVGDTKAAAVFAIETGDASGDPASVVLNVDGLNGRIAKLVGAETTSVRINDLAVNPLSGNVYLSVAMPAARLLRLDSAGKLSALALKDVKFSKVSLPNPPEDKITGEGRRRRNRRDESITDLAYVEGKVLISGLSHSDSPSTVREVPFPFNVADDGINIEIYHGAHGKLEDHAAVRTFVPFVIDGEPNLLAGFTCTPLVKFPIAALSSDNEKLRGTTVAELGNWNRPLDMIVYEKDGQDFLLMANTSRGVMKISTEDIGRTEGIGERVPSGGTAGQPYETIEKLKGVVQLDRLNNKSAIVLVQTEGGEQNVRTVALP